jgi:predicted house-cleaning noncanonical NTP pyrophosphatase (MazG superfamily)
MTKDVDNLFKEAIFLFNEKKYEEAKEILEVLKSSEYKPAYKVLLTVYKELGEAKLEEELKEIIANDGRTQNPEIKNPSQYINNKN